MTEPTAAERVFCLIPARSGSQRVRDKNLQELGGQSLLERAIRTSIEAFGSVVVSTDSETYARIARAAGATVPGLRPAALATDDAPIDAAVQHALHALGGADAEVLVLVQATSPFTTARDLLDVVAALRRHPEAGCALTVVRREPAAAALLVQGPDGLGRFVDPDLAGRRTQDVPPLAVPTGGAYAARTGRLLNDAPLLAQPYALVWVDSERALDIDDPDDLARAHATMGVA